MECIVLAENAAKRQEIAWALEDLGADWRCAGAATAEQALLLLAQRPAMLAVLSACPEAAAFARQLEARPLLAPPYLLGDGFPAADGLLPEAPMLPTLLQAWKRTGRLPALHRLRLPEATGLARGMLHALGIPPGLRAWAFLPEMAGLTAVHPPLLTDMTHGLYPLMARRHGMTPGAVERSLRLCVEATWSRGDLAALERFFGSSVDPDRGKPTNREFLCRVQERVTLGARRLEM